MSLALLLLACTGAPEVESPPDGVEAAEPAEVIAAPKGPQPGADGLVEAAGVELVRAHCGACHSTALVQQNHMSRERWDQTLTWMQQTQGLWDLPPTQRGAILDYLAAWQGEDTQATPSSPWASPLYEPNPLW